VLREAAMMHSLKHEGLLNLKVGRCWLTLSNPR